jgi:hypothetical protein
MNKIEMLCSLSRSAQSRTIIIRLRTRLINAEDMIAVILDAAPPEYQAVLTNQQHAKGDALKQSDLEDAMNQHGRQLIKGKQLQKKKIQS